jgi:neopullulanase
MAIHPDMLGKVIYHLLTDRFKSVHNRSPVEIRNPLAFHGGTYAGIQEEIQAGFFEELGIDVLQITPPYDQVPPQWDQAAQRSDWGAHGYWPDTHQRANHRFGSLGNLKQVAEEAEMQLILDMVHHVGVDSSLYGQRPEWFTSPRTWFWSLPELNLARQDVKSYVFQALNHWNGDGKHLFRWDTLHHLPRGYVRELFSTEDSPARNVWSVGEVLHGDPAFLKEYLALGCPSVYNYPLWYCFSEELSFGKGNLGKVGDTFNTMFSGENFHPAQLVNFAQNHDMDLLRTYYRSKGEASKDSLERLKMALSLIFLVPGIPSIYYLDSTGWTGQNFSDPNRSGRWNLEWPADKGVFYNHLCCLSRVYKNTPALSHGGYRELWRPGNLNPAPIFAFERKLGANGEVPVIVVVNNDDVAQGVRIPVSMGDTNALMELLGTRQDFIVQEGHLIGLSPARSVLALTAMP